MLLAPMLIALVSSCLLGCGPESESAGSADHAPQATARSSEPAPAPSPSREAGTQGPFFIEATEASGLDYVHFNGMSGELYFNEMVGPGAAMLDYDGDGDLDLFFVQGDLLGEGKSFDQATMPPRHPTPLSHRLYRNELDSNAGGTPSIRFVDVTEESGLAEIGVGGYGMGVTVGDIDNDGDPDLYITAGGRNQLLQNQGDGRFRELTKAAGEGATDLSENRWSVASTFFDFDRDGWLDLYVGNYVAYAISTHKHCVAATGARDYCGPHSYRPHPDRLFRNLGPGPDGRPRFEDVTSRVGLDSVAGAGLGVVPFDLDQDGWLDLYVANDGSANHLWRNLGGEGRSAFEDVALLAGTAFNRDGHAEAGMGVDAGDVDNDGDEDLFLSHLTQETNTLYRSLGGGQFDDVTSTTGLGTASWSATGFGTGFVDFDGDGHLDLAVANGAVKIIEALQRANDPYPLHQTNQLFRNRGDGSYEEIEEAFTEPSEVSRGLAFGDLDNDGDTDLILTNNSGPARLYLGQARDRQPDSEPSAHWLGLRLLDRHGRDALGAWVTLRVFGDSDTAAPATAVFHRRVTTGGGYASARDPRLLFGLSNSAIDRVHIEVRWPERSPASATRAAAPDSPEIFRASKLDQYLTLQEGEGE